jgi:hypothetical protein
MIAEPVVRWADKTNGSGELATCAHLYLFRRVDHHAKGANRRRTACMLSDVLGLSEAKTRPVDT